MGPLTIASTALSSLGANKLRTGLALLGIVIGVAAVISTMSVGRGAQETITSRIEELGTNLLFVRPSIPGQSFFSGGNVVVFRSASFSGQDPTSTLTLDDADALKDPVFTPHVVAVAPEISTSGQIVAGRENTFAQIIGVTPAYESARNYATASGTFITREHVATVDEAAVLGSEIAETLFGNRDPVGQNVRINGRQFAVAGVLESRGSTALSNLDSLVLVPITTAYYRLSAGRTAGGGVAVSSINVQIDDPANREETIADVATVLRLRHRVTEEDDFTITSQEETIETLTETQETFALFLGAIAGISLLVGGIGIMNIMMVSVTERTREIGVRKAMGAKWRDILLQFVAEATLLSFGGGIAGVILGVTLSRLMDGRNIIGQTFETAVSGDITVLALVVAAGIGLFFGIYPAAKAANLHPIEALRYE
jgi:putative ABC transport system permease protein